MKFTRRIMLGTSALAVVAMAFGAVQAQEIAPGQTFSQADIDAALQVPSTITVWSWASFIKPAIAEFQTRYPNVKVDLVNVGQGQAEYTKISNAVLSGTGGPDLAMTDYLQLPEFVLTGALQDLTPFGLQAAKDDYADAVWKSLIFGDMVVGLPQNTSPLVLFYRQDVFAEAGIEVPKTWDEVLTAADTLKAKTGSAIMDIDPGNAGAIFGLIQQTGFKPFSYDGVQTVKINLSSPEVEKVANMLTKLIQSGGAEVDPALTDDWYQSLVKKKYVSWVSGAAGQNNLINTLADQAGLWRVAPLPQWTAGEYVDGNVGGSATVMMKASQNKLAAYALAQFLFHDHDIVAMGANRAFPTLKSVLQSDEFLSAESPFFGNQKVNELYAAAEEAVHVDFEWLPFMSFVTSTFNTTVGLAMTQKADLFPAFKDWEAQVIDYAKQQGFTVN